MIEAFKFLDYSQLAKKSLISKRFRDVIQTHRHSLPRLYIWISRMRRIHSCEGHLIKMFNEELSAEAYNAWVNRNQYLKQIPLKIQIDGEESTQHDCDFYELQAYTDFPDGCFLSARAELNHENWPLFQHFVRLVSDPFVYFRILSLDSQSDVLKLLAGAINSDHDRLQCKELQFELYGNIQQSINWLKDHVWCNLFGIYDHMDSNHDQELLDFFMTGAYCSSSIWVDRYDVYNVVIDFLKKFRDLKVDDEYQFVQSIACYKRQQEENQVAQLLKREYRKFLVKEKTKKEDMDRNITTYDFEFNNDDIGKKLRLRFEICHDENRRYYTTEFLLDIKDL